MKYRDYIESVQSRGQFETEEDAEKATRAVFEVLSERLTGDQADAFAGFLPAELKEYLQESRKPSGFDTDDFLSLLGRKEGVGATIAGYHARVVLSVLAAAVPVDELTEIIPRLPKDIRDLFMVESWVKEEKC